MLDLAGHRPHGEDVVLRLEIWRTWLSKDVLFVMTWLQASRNITDFFWLCYCQIFKYQIVLPAGFERDKSNNFLIISFTWIGVRLYIKVLTCRSTHPTLFGNRPLKRSWSYLFLPVKTDYYTGLHLWSYTSPQAWYEAITWILHTRAARKVELVHFNQV